MCTVHDNFIIVTLRCIWAQKHIIMCFNDKRLLLFTTIVTATILFTNELSTSSIVVLCSCQKFIDVSHQEINIKVEIAIFFKNRI